MVRKKVKDTEEIQDGLIYDQILSFTNTFGDIEVRNFEDSVRFSEYIPIGLPHIDEKLDGGKGLPKGGIIEFYGLESSGKSHLALKICANAQKKYPEQIVVYYDLETALIPERCKFLGVDLNKNKFIVIDNNLNADVLFNQMIKMIEDYGKNISLVVLDSVTSLIPKDLYERENENRTTLLAQLLSKKLKILNTVANKNNVCVIFINQLRENINMQGGGYGVQTYTPGGKALKYYALCRLEIRKVSKSDNGIIFRDKEIIGHKSIAKIIKNKIGSPIGDDIFPVYYEDGVSVQDRLFWVGRELDHYEDKTKIIQMYMKKFTFNNHTYESEDAFKEAMIPDGFIDDLYETLLKSGYADGLTYDDIETAKKIWADDRA